VVATPLASRHRDDARASNSSAKSQPYPAHAKLEADVGQYDVFPRKADINAEATSPLYGLQWHEQCEITARSARRFCKFCAQLL
jgi:hypothetical protein